MSAKDVKRNITEFSVRDDMIEGDIQDMSSPKKTGGEERTEEIKSALKKKGSPRKKEKNRVKFGIVDVKEFDRQIYLVRTHVLFFFLSFEDVHSDGARTLFSAAGLARRPEGTIRI